MPISWQHAIELRTEQWLEETRIFDAGRKNNFGTLYFDKSIMKESSMYMDDLGVDVSEPCLFLFG